jgi:hypothetical protein
MEHLKIPLRLVALAALCAACPLARAQHLADTTAAASRTAAQFRPAESVAPSESAAALGSAASPSSQQVSDTTPPGMVAFFMTQTCPTGWAVPASVQGRLIVGVNDASNVGLTVGTAMASQTAPAHQHAYSTTVTLNSKNIALANGDNEQGAKKGDYKVGGTTESSTSNLPFIQLTVCQKQF